jgi:hypothetical protein
MRKALAIVGSALALAALAPIASEAAGGMGMSSSRGQQGGSFRGQSFHHGQNFRGQNFHGHPFPNNRSNFYRSRYYRPNYYWPFYYPYYSSYGSSYYSAPPSYAPQQSYPGYYPGFSDAPYGFGAPSGSLELAPAPQIEREVVFAEGRYVLLGDGEATPFRWVWVPNPPTAPPSEPQDQR